MFLPLSPPLSIPNPQPRNPCSPVHAEDPPSAYARGQSVASWPLKSLGRQRRQERPAPALRESLFKAVQDLFLSSELSNLDSARLEFCSERPDSSCAFWQGSSVTCAISPVPHHLLSVDEDTCESSPNHLLWLESLFGSVWTVGSLETPFLPLPWRSPRTRGVQLCPGAQAPFSDGT